MGSASGLVDGKKLVVTGVLMESSIAFAVARLAQEQGADIVLTAPPKGFGITKRIAARLPKPVEVIQLDVTSTEDLEALPAAVEAVLGDRIDGVLHAIGFAPE